MDNKLDEINKTLSQISESVRLIADTMVKPENKFLQIIQYGTGVVGIMGILTIIDIIVRWVLGG
jgi:hypothetical protein